MNEAVQDILARAAQPAAGFIPVNGNGDTHSDIVAFNDRVLAAEIERLRAELAKAQATIDARPVVGKTADGVEVRIGDQVWMLDEELVWYVEPGGTIGCNAGVSYSWPVTLAYSTREAAKAAEGKSRQAP